MEDSKEPKVDLSKMTDEQLRQKLKVKLVKFVCICSDHPSEMNSGQVDVLPAVARIALDMLD